MKSFLKIIASRLLNKFPKSMENIAVVLPSKRSIVFLKSYLSKQITKPIFLPQFFSIEDFIENLSNLKVLDNLSLQFYLYQSYLQNPPTQADSFDKFMNWSNMLLHDFNEVDRNLVDPKDIFTNLKNVKELEHWSLKEWSFSESELTDSQKNYIDFYNKFFQWYRNFNSRLLKKNHAYQGMAYRKAAHEIEKKEIVWDKIWFVGLNALTKAEQKILDVLKEKDIARVFWDADEYYYNNPNHEAGEFLRAQSDNWMGIDFEGVGNYYNQKKDSFNVIACPKNISQAIVTSNILSNLSSSDLSDSNTAIVLADEGLLYPVLNHLPSNVQNINVTMGSPVKSTPFYSFLDAIFEMQLCTYLKEQKDFYYKNLLRVINHPLLLHFISSEIIINLRNEISEKNKVHISTDFVKEFLNDDFINVNYIFSRWETIEDAFRMLETLINFLRRTLVDKKNNVESEILFTLNSSFQILKNLISECTFSVDLKTLHSLIKQLISKEVIPFKGEPLKGVQLMGILESRTLDFKNVIILSVNEGKLPKSKTLNSFIPYDLKMYFNMPTYRENDAIFSYHFYRLLQRAKNVNILYNSETDDFGSGEKSRFITQLISEYPYEINQYVYSEKKIIFSKRSPVVVENNEVRKQIQKWGKYVSPTSLNMYNNCSLSFYYYYLIGIRKSNEVSEYAEADIIGSAIHEAFKDVYPKGNVLAKDLDNIRDCLLDTVEDKFIKIGRLESVISGKNYLNLEVAKKLTINFLEYEKSYLLLSSQKSLSLNILESEIELQHTLNIGGINFVIKGKIDRIDEYDDHIRIIDYKSGSVKVSDLSFRKWDEFSEAPYKPKALQLLIYAYLYIKNNPSILNRKVIVGNFAFKNLQEGLITLSSYENNKKEILYIDNENIQQIENIIIDVIRKIMNSDFSENQNQHFCEYCN